ncbi:hypothetical protein JJB07_05315 [Tumebacillus sp. ITR2]|uniref:Uncharacterized protein n=1 Tax=Tumebacillus amylolyticus TaxID=2801339 RepID=A0ABS1J702_9BACL|nr:hypothetical protein [Tumebacillus amylolyticus]MBL0386067.1 hypothetical protein [Tumebacillus amylolyticus]
MNFTEITKMEAIQKLSWYKETSEEIFKLLDQFRKATGNEQQVIKGSIEERYSSVKLEVKEYYNLLSKASTVKNYIAEALFWPAIQDIYVHISSVAKNRVGSDKFVSAVYDIGSYAGYWLGVL